MSSRLSRTLLASEVAVTTVVLTGAVFAGIGIWRFHEPAARLSTSTDRFGVSFPAIAGASPEGVDWIGVREAVRRVEGVRAASAVFESSRERVRLGDQILERDAAAVLELGADGIAALGLRLLAGRAPTPTRIRRGRAGRSRGRTIRTDPLARPARRRAASLGRRHRLRRDRRHREPTFQSSQGDTARGRRACRAPARTERHDDLGARAFGTEI